MLAGYRFGHEDQPCSHIICRHPACIQGLYLRKTHIRGIVPLSIALHGGLDMSFGIGIDGLMTRQQVIFERPGEAIPVDGTRPFATQSLAPGTPSGFTLRF